jgi:type IV pilus assembly protein PilW
MKRERGFTIVEIMVALAVSLLLMAGVIQVFAGNRETYRLQAGLATLQENARFAVDLLRRDLSMAGYPGEMNIAAFDIAKTGDGGGNVSDTVAINFLTNRDCTGTAIANGINTRVYTVGLDATTGGSVLQCDGVTVVDGVENIQFLYGVDTETGRDRDFLPNKYLTADKVTAAEWADDYVVAVRFALLLNSVEAVAREKDTTSFVVLDAPAIPAADDYLRRRVFFGTVAIRNRHI